MPTILSTGELADALSLRDLSDGPHAVRLVAEAITQAVEIAYPAAEIRLLHDHPLVPVEDNYEKLGYPPDAVTRDARYTRYASETCMLRSHTTAMIPPALREIAREPASDTVLICRGVVYRRDAVDRIHTGTPHQMDLWRVATGPLVTSADLDALIETVIHAALPGAVYRAVPATHPYTEDGRQVDVLVSGEWLEVAECGLAARHVLSRSGLGDNVSGLAMGLGLDRLVMLRKRITDIRLLSSTDPRIAGQMLDLSVYRPVSKHPPITRDISVAVAADADAETLGALVRDAVGSSAVEEILVLGETALDDLPPAAIDRLGIGPGQKNVLLRVVLRHPSRTMSDEEANTLRDRIHAALANCVNG
jgi:phenylalanyl-tRNA synthetase alpha chain